MAFIQLSFIQQQFTLDLLYDLPKILSAIVLSLSVVGAIIALAYSGGIAADIVVGSFFGMYLLLLGYTYWKFLCARTQQEDHPEDHPIELGDLGTVDWPQPANLENGEPGEDNGVVEGDGSGLAPSGGSVE